MRKAFWLILLFILGFAIIGGVLYMRIFNEQAIVGEGKFDLKIRESVNLESVVDSLKAEGLKRTELFGYLAKRMNYRDDNLKHGLYEVNRNQSLVDLIRHLRSGKQKPVNVTINGVRTIPDLAGKITRQLELDSLTLLNFLRDNQLTHDTLMTRFIPNTYRIYWNIGPQQLLDRMDQERKRFFASEDRLVRADSLGLTPTEVYTLASIVEQESTLDAEKPTIASVYLNRIERGIKLQADPTVVFANQDFGIRRVLNRHLAIDSPYNTYKHQGLPPGPICMPSISSIDAVLNPDDTDYIFFCAKPGYQNGHAFASNLRQHNNNARRYREWLREEGIN